MIQVQCSARKPIDESASSRIYLESSLTCDTVPIGRTARQPFTYSEKGTSGMPFQVKNNGRCGPEIEILRFYFQNSNWVILRVTAVSYALARNAPSSTLDYYVNCKSGSKRVVVDFSLVYGNKRMDNQPGTTLVDVRFKA
jgi:hypothetical protein